MPAPFIPINAALCAAVRDRYRAAVDKFRSEGRDFHSLEFLDSFPYRFLDAENISSPPQRGLLQAGFDDLFKERTQRAIAAFYSGHQGGSPEHYFIDMIDDFLNYAMPRCAGLADEDARFEQFYREFERDVFSDTFTVRVVAHVNGLYDHGGNFRPVAGFSLRYARKLPCDADTAYFRDAVVPWCELRKAAHGEIGEHVFLVLEFTEEHKRTEKAMGVASDRSWDIAKKFVFAVRLLSDSTCFCDYLGYRVPGQLAPYGLLFMEQRKAPFEERQGTDVPGRLRALLPHLVNLPYERIAVLDHKFEDALRRPRKGGHWDAISKKRVVIDQLLDYFQALESLLPAPSGQEIALYAGVLLGGHLDDGGKRATGVAHLVKDMHQYRNEVMHGRIDGILNGRFEPKYKTVLDLWPLKQVVSELAILRIVNDVPGGGGMLRLAESVALGQKPPLSRI